ncbi:hypothetical protein EUTSA_v10027565mg [Eutrema salsugineum]|uniref:Pectinesterase inhibitor domain-containing protein n=1 Tax=Eutrema salsugineum TaxID=72664 RepID=V4MG26_EUTSA|nr:hypothetical protein EUTSA_v10027565mg [Eutrema salsugineum]
MVVYVKKNFSLAHIVVLLLFVVSSYARSSMMVTKDEIEVICTKKDMQINSSLCFEILKATPEAAKLDLPSLVKYLIEYQSRNVSDTLKQIKLFRGHTTDMRKMKDCEQLYEGALSGIDDSLKALAAKDYFLSHLRNAGTFPNMHTCIDTLSTMKPVPEVLSRRSSVIIDITNIICVIIDCFIRGKNCVIAEIL